MSQADAWFRLLLVCAAAAAISACDPIYGLRTDAELAQPPDTVCIDQAVREVQGAGEVVHTTKQAANYQLLPYRGTVTTVTDIWQYGPGQKAIIQVQGDGERWQYRNGLERMGSPLTTRELDAFAPLMARMNAALESHCGLTVGRVSRN